MIIMWLLRKSNLPKNGECTWIAPHHKNFTVNLVPDLMARMADDGTTHGAVIILDTLKKLSSLLEQGKEPLEGD